MTSGNKRTWWHVTKTCWYPEVRWQTPYEIESADGLDQTRGWLVTVEWLGFMFQVAGGRFRPLQRAAAESPQPRKPA